VTLRTAQTLLDEADCQARARTCRIFGQKSGRRFADALSSGGLRNFLLPDWIRAVAGWIRKILTVWTNYKEKRHGKEFKAKLEQLLILRCAD
jgi:hypothetical protein